MPQFDPNEVIASPLNAQPVEATPAPVQQTNLKAAPLGGLGREYDMNEVIAIPPEALPTAAEVYGKSALGAAIPTLTGAAGAGAATAAAAPLIAGLAEVPPLAAGVGLLAAGTGAVGGSALGQTFQDWLFPKSDRLKFGEEMYPTEAALGQHTAALGAFGNPMATGRALMGNTQAIRQAITGGAINVGLGAGTELASGASLNQVVNNVPSNFGLGLVMPGNAIGHVAEGVGSAPVRGIAGLFNRPAGAPTRAVTPAEQAALLAEAQAAQEVPAQPAQPAAPVAAQPVAAPAQPEPTVRLTRAEVEALIQKGREEARAAQPVEQPAAVEQPAPAPEAPAPVAEVAPVQPTQVEAAPAPVEPAAPKPTPNILEAELANRNEEIRFIKGEIARRQAELANDTRNGRSNPETVKRIERLKNRLDEAETSLERLKDRNAPRSELPKPKPVPTAQETLAVKKREFDNITRQLEAAHRRNADDQTIAMLEAEQERISGEYENARLDFESTQNAEPEKRPPAPKNTPLARITIPSERPAAVQPELPVQRQAPRVEPPKPAEPNPRKSAEISPPESTQAKPVAEAPKPSAQTEIPGTADTFNLAGERIAGPRELTAEEQAVRNRENDTTTGDLLNPKVAEARKQLAKLEANGRGETMQAQALRRTIEQETVSKPVEQPKAPVAEKPKAPEPAAAPAPAPVAETPAVEAPKPAKAKPVRKPTAGEPAEVVTARRRVENPNTDPYRYREAVKVLDQHENDQRLMQYDKETDLSKVSDEALSDFLNKAQDANDYFANEGTEMPKEQADFIDVVERHAERRFRAASSEVYGDLLADIRDLAKRGVGLPVLPKEFADKFKISSGRQFADIIGRLAPGSTREPALYKADPKRAKIDPEYRKEIKKQFDGMVEDYAMALKDIGWTQVDPSNVNSWDAVSELVSKATNGDKLVPKGEYVGRKVKGGNPRLYTAGENQTASGENPFSLNETEVKEKTKATLVAEANRVFRDVKPEDKGSAYDTHLSEYKIDGTMLEDAGEAKDQILSIARQVEKDNPEVARRLREIVNPPAEPPAAPRNTEQDARKADDLDTRVERNAANRANDNPARRGYQAIIDRAVFEARKTGKISDKEVEGLTRILNMVGSKFFEGVKLSIRGGQDGQQGQYESANRIVSIFKEAIQNGRFEDTAAHEVAHHLSQFLPEVDRAALRKEWLDARRDFLKKNPGFAKLVGAEDADWTKVRIKGTDLQRLAKEHPELTKDLRFTQIPGKGEPMYRVRATDEMYRLFNANEWFSETFKDVVRKRLNSDPVYTENPTTWKDKLVQLWEGIKTNFRQMFGKDQAARILSNFAKGRYEAEAKGSIDIHESAYESRSDEALAVIPKDAPINEENGAKVLNSLHDESTKGNPDADLIPRPKPNTSVARQAQDVLTGRYFSGISGKAHQNAERSGSATVKEVANIIHARPGTESNAFEADLPTATMTKRTEFQNRFNNAMKPLRETLAGFKDTDTGSAKDQRETVYKALTDMITGRRAVTEGKLGESAKALKDLLAEVHKYRTDAGEKLNHVSDYYPAVYDSGLIGANKDAFVKDATRAYKEELNQLIDEDLAKELGVSKADIATGDRAALIAEGAAAKAEALYQVHAMGGDADMASIFGQADRGGAENPSMSRVFGKQAQAIMAKYQVADPFRVVGRYIGNSVKRAELVRRFGADGKKWKGMADKMIAEGADQATVDEMRDLVRIAAGVGIPPRGRAAQTYVDTVTLMTAASAMGRGFINNLVEPVSIGMRAGSPGAIARAYAETWARFLREVPALSPAIKEKMGETFWQKYGEHIGTIHNSMEDAWMTTHSMDLNADEADPRMRWLTNRIYKANLMDASEVAKQQAAHAIGYSYVRDLARWTKGEHWANKAFGIDPKQSVADNLNELGIKPDKHKAFADWVLELDKVKDDAELMRRMTDEKDPMARLHREAMTRFSMQGSVRSNRAHRPVFQDDLLGKTVLQLMNFSYSYAAEVNSRVYDMAKRGVMPSPEGKDYNAADRIRLMAPAAGAVLSVLAYRGLLELKDILYPTPASEKRAKDPQVVQWANAASYAGVFGPKVEQMMKVIKRDQPPGGPAGQIAVNVGRAGAATLDAMAEGKDFSSAKKAAAKAAIPIVKGGVVAGASAINPVLGAATVQAANTTGWSNKISESFKTKK